MANGKWTAFIERFSNQWSLKALYNIAQHSPIHAPLHVHIQTLTAVSTTQGDGQLVGSLLRDTTTQLGGAGDRTSNLLVTSQPALP